VSFLANNGSTHPLIDPEDLQLSPVFRQSVSDPFIYYFLPNFMLQHWIPWLLFLPPFPVFHQSYVLYLMSFFFYIFFVDNGLKAAVDGLNDRPGNHHFKSLIIGSDGPYVPFPSHSFLTYFGPQVYMLLLDCR
jgi:hypothetical protein